MLPQSQFSPSYFTLGCCGCWAQWPDTTIMCHTNNNNNNNNNNNTISCSPGGGVSLQPKCYICSADTSCNAIVVTFSGVLTNVDRIFSQAHNLKCANNMSCILSTSNKRLGRNISKYGIWVQATCLNSIKLLSLYEYRSKDHTESIRNPPKS